VSPFTSLKASADSQALSGMSSTTPDNIVLAVPYNRNGAQKPVKRCKSSNFGLACDCDFLEYQLEELRSKISTGYARGRLPSARDRKE
jgi:hypothetical protein